MLCLFLFRVIENTAHIREYGTVVLLIGVIILTFLKYILTSRSRNLPPGPIGLPIFGYYPFLGKEPWITLNELAKKYGNVVGLYLGSQYVVFVNDWDAVKDALGQNVTLDRPPKMFAKIPYNLGFSGKNGEEWMHTRRMATKTMKDAGSNLSRWEELMQEDILELVRDIIKKDGRPVEVRSFFQGSFTNNIIAFILGVRLSAGHPVTKNVAEAVGSVLENIATLDMSKISPKVCWILQMLGLEKRNCYDKVFELCNFVSDFVDEKVKDLDIESEDSFIANFQSGMENHRKSKGMNSGTSDILKGTIVTLLTGGAETGRIALIWALIAMADHPDIQQKVHEELDRVIGKEGSIGWSDRNKVPYTQATIMESMRWKTAAPIPALRIVTEDTKVQGYHIPKGTFITTSNFTLHNDPRYWKNPDQFIPERFLQDDDTINASPDSFNPFSYGKRSCPGKVMAQVQVLKYFTILMQKFQVLPKEGNKVKYDTQLGLLYEATNVELRFLQR